MLRYRLGRGIRTAVSSFWFWPLLSIAFALWLSSTLDTITRRLPVVGASSEALAQAAELYAGAILTTTAAVDITILTFVFSTLMVVLQLASNQLSPRIIRTILRDGSAQFAMAIMVGGFVFSLASLFTIYEDRHPLVAAVCVIAGIMWTIVIVLTFLRFVSYIIARMRAPAVILSLGESVARDIGHAYRIPPTPAHPIVPTYPVKTVLRAPRDGVLTGLRLRDLGKWATQNEALISLHAELGDHVSAGVPIGTVTSSQGFPPLTLSPFMTIQRERTVRGDPPYGFRLLVDIANRALSPAVNDPTTASQVLDQLESLLILLDRRGDEPGRVFDDEGVLRVDARVKDWTSYLLLAVQEIYEFGRDSSQVTQRLDRMLASLADTVSQERIEAVRRLREQIDVIGPMLCSRSPEPASAESANATP